MENWRLIAENFSFAIHTASSTGRYNKIITSSIALSSEDEPVIP